MYKYSPPHPIIIKLADANGFELRKKAGEFVSANISKGAERGSKEQQGFGALAEIVIRKYLRMPELKPEDHPFGYDILLPSKVKVDVKCRGGGRPFQETYLRDDGLPREAKHNLFARQVYDDNLDADIYLMTHLETPKEDRLPGTKRQKKWVLYVCGWLSKERAKKQGVYLPRYSLTERGKNDWFVYRGQEIEYYNKNLNGLSELSDLLKIEKIDVDFDKNKKGDLNLTSVDALRISYDLIGRGILNERHVQFIKNKLNIKGTVSSFLHPNQYYHLLKWLKENNQVTNKEIKNLEKELTKKDFEGI